MIEKMFKDFSAIEKMLDEMLAQDPSISFLINAKTVAYSASDFSISTLFGTKVSNKRDNV